MGEGSFQNSVESIAAKEKQGTNFIVFLFILWLQLCGGWLCVCVNVYCCLKWTDNGHSSRKGGFVLVLCATDPPQTLFKILSSKAFSRHHLQQLFSFFSCHNLFGTKFTNIFSGSIDTASACCKHLLISLLDNISL